MSGAGDAPRGAAGQSAGAIPGAGSQGFADGLRAGAGAVVRCPACNFAAADVDDACGSCGGPLAVLAVVDGRVRLDASSDEVEVHVENRGVVGASFVLRSIDARSFPPWLMSFPELDKAVLVGAGERVPVKFRVDASRLPLAGASERSSGRVVVPLVTSVVRFDAEAGRAVRRVLAVELATAGRPASSPRAASYRFIPRELVDDGAAIVRPLTVRNDGGHAVMLTGLALVARDVVIPRGASLLAPEAILALPALPKPEPIAPGASLVVDARLRLLPGRLPQGALGAFAADVVFTFQAEGAPAGSVTTSIDGVVGDGPRVAAPESVTVHTGGRPQRGVVVVENPGAVPVRVHSVEVVGDEDTDEGDWLRLVDDTALIGGGANDSAFLLQPDEQRSIAFVVDPERRRGAALERPWGRRTLRLTHDGVRGPHTDVVVAAELGRVRTLETTTLGVDFGTSNSSASLYFGPGAALQALALDREAQRESMASSMFYVGTGSGQGADFLFGQAAENAAPLLWTNLVKGLKSVVAREPGTRWNFCDPQSGRLVETLGAQALLDRFIVESKRRAEDGLRALPMPSLARLGLVDTGVRFKHAVFSHPVGADEQYLAALHRAARAAGLVDVDCAQQFAAERCVDEATAAVVAYVHIAAGADVPVVDEERVLCFDIGGGTTDIAAVEVTGLASFRRDPAGRSVDLVLRAAGGDPRFGGGDVDKLLASFVLDALAQKAELAPFEIDEVRRATFFPSYEAFRRARGAASDGDASTRARAIYSRATDVLRAAERIKLALSNDPASPALYVPALDDWPLRLSTSTNVRRPSARVEIRVTANDLRHLLQQPLARASSLILPVIRDAGWRADDVTTLLFTGQSSRLTDVRAAVKNALTSQRSTAPTTKLHVVEPGAVAGFDPKRCVAQGAAVWGDSKLGGGGWLRISRRSKSALSSTLQARRGPLLVDVPGLGAGTALPARARLEFPEPQKSITLYRAGLVAWTFDLPQASRTVDVVVEGEHAAHAVSGEGARAEGRRET